VTLAIRLSRVQERVKQMTLAATILGSSIAAIDATIVNVALPAIESDLGGGLAGQQWVVNGYLLILGSLILVGGSLGDVFGERRVFALGVGLFGATSLLCGIAPSIELLVVGRALQGVAGALLTPSALAVIIATFPDEERGTAIGTWTAWGGIATVAGPLAGGELVEIASWRWIFLVNLPFVAACLVMIARYMPAETRELGRRRIDLIGGTLAALGLGGPVFALIEQPRLGWGSPGVLLPLAAGAVLLAAFVWYEGRRAPDPMLPLRLFRRHNFWAGNVETLAMYGGLSMVFFLLVLFLQEVSGYTPLQAALSTLPVTLVMFALSKWFGRLADRHGPRWFMGGGPIVSAAGLLLLLRLDEDISYAVDLFPALVIFSLGLSITVAPLTAAVLACVNATQAGIASAVNNAVARVAGLLGVAVTGALMGGNLTASSFQTGVAVSAALVALGGVLGAVAIRNPVRIVRAEHSAGGQVVGASRDAAGCPEAWEELPTVRVPAMASSES
jgi:EmrB/QacA subfamily drug resistance transporter